MRFAIIGLGRMGRRHIQVAMNLGFEVVGIYDLFQGAIDETLKEFPALADKVFSSAEALLDNAQGELLAVSTTAPSHAQFVCHAARSGFRYILCEKPMAVSLAEADAMISACEASGAVLAVNHQMQFMEQYTKIREAIATGEYGDLRSVTVHASNFGLAMNAVHYFEMFRYVTGENLKSVQCWVDDEKVPNPRGPQYSDYSGQVRALSDSGIRFNLEAGGDLGHGIQVIYGCRNGQIIVDELAGRVRAIRRQEEFRDLPTTRYGMPVVVEEFSIAPADVLTPTADVWKAMLSGASFPNGAIGRHAMATLVACYASGEADGRLTAVDDSLPAQKTFNWA
ncbi:Gfo/Idh/MocA family oxidoreductase [Pseudomonas xanthosomatis]|uniref:Gfo/Idh/MocA family protein n=1 Tax=Pseudomonas xanthosomatis TaxID=2842356 RepID=UPI001C3DAB2F|nr:Gfo/Idh/MocA family oxidoreductase [Pseudomonas xanthosomatis]QXH48309.1 Gfo/Idh/MocA family oxidoreductase [Pseudomonas xanthosomatis]